MWVTSPAGHPTVLTARRHEAKAGAVKLCSLILCWNFINTMHTSWGIKVYKLQPKQVRGKVRGVREDNN